MRRRIRLWLWRYRHVLAVTLFAGAALLVLSELSPAPPGPQVVVAARPLPAGHRIEAQDVRLQALAVPEHEVVSDPVGQVLAVAIPSGLPIADSMIVGPGISDQAPPGTVVVPVPLADPTMLQLLRVGDRVDIYGTGVDIGIDGFEAELITTGALVLALAGNETGQAPDLLGINNHESTAFIAAIDTEAASLFTGASTVSPFRVVITSTQ